MSGHDVSRRDFLKRGALLGGALVWTTPVVQVVGMNPALAQVASPACNVWYAVKIEREEEESCPTGFTTIPPSPGSTNNGCCTDITGGVNEPGQCLDADGAPPDDEDLTPGGCTHIQSVQIPDEGAGDTSWSVKLDDDCQFVPDSGRCTVKTGTGQEGCVSDACTYDHETRTLTFAVDGAGDISHVEFAFCCET